ncbi:hypothetical protein [Caulobacter phage Cr30]|uniref:hypothetical protein n=1 Tax=Caulobacter phage Cr30 TaxID=1357714 RepID=UPI0004A9B547|nr:hypothetical protein OZ74_gp210 [Caulobacter phage Cr30]AGS81133.1 hypothetical protein [Caulobacter phage Cr30]
MTDWPELKPEHIKYVACRFDDKVVVGPMPYRHHHIVNIASQLGFRCSQYDQGFSVDGETFIDRIQAAKIAIETGQIQKLNWPPNLYSEDLW